MEAFCGGSNRGRLMLFEHVLISLQVGMEAAFPAGTSPVSAPVSALDTADLNRSQPRPTAGARLVHHALAAVAADFVAGSLTGYNPLVIVGPAGSGKSRLVSEWFVNQGLEHGLEHGLEKTAGQTASHKTPTQVMWDGRSLGRDLAAALSHNTIDRMHERFVSSRLIIVDGVEQITAWDVQRALAHLFDASIAAGTAFIATLRIHPIACTSLEASLASRLAGGLVVSMPPGNTTRCPADNDVFDLRPTTTLRRVIGATARKHGLTAADLTGPSRCRQVSHARGMAMYLSRRLTPASLGTIGTAFGGRDHTTVLHGIRVTEERRSLHPGIAAEIDQLIATLVRP